MVGRSAYHNPWWMREWDASVGKPLAVTERIDVEISMVRYMEHQAALGVNWYGVARHMLGLWTGQAGARKWRQVWSDHRLKSHSPSQVHELATQARLLATPQTEPSAS